VVKVLKEKSLWTGKRKEAWVNGIFSTAYRNKVYDIFVSLKLLLLSNKPDTSEYTVLLYAKQHKSLRLIPIRGFQKNQTESVHSLFLKNLQELEIFL